MSLVTALCCDNRGIFFCSEISKKLIKPLQSKILLLYLHCKTKPHTTMIDIVELARIARCIHTGRIPRLGDVAVVISPRGAKAASVVIEAFRNRYRNGRMSAQEVVKLSNWAGLPVATFTAVDVDVNLDIKLTNHHDDDNQELPAVRLVEITKELHTLSLDGLEGAPFYATMAMRMRLHRERERIFRAQERKAKQEQAKKKKQQNKLKQPKNGK